MVFVSKMVVVVKVNVYGYGFFEIVWMFFDVDVFGVVCFEEVLWLCVGGIIKFVLLFEGFFDVRDLLMIFV